MQTKLTIALSGNPNAGKSTVFNAITGARQHIANYPGVTVEKKYGSVVHKGREIDVVDLPGTYSLTAYSIEEIVARDFLINEKPDLVIDIVDASNLDRNLYLAVQFKELGIPLIIALNMIDLAESKNIVIDHRKLSDLLGVPVVPMVARANKGIKELLDKVVETAQTDSKWEPSIISYGMDVDQALSKVEDIIKKSSVFDMKYPPRWRALKCLEGDRLMVELLKQDPALAPRIDTVCRRIFKHITATHDVEPEAIIADHRYGYITGITKRAVNRKIELRLNMSDKIDKVLTNRMMGPIFMIAILYGIYLFTFWVSEIPIHWFELFFDYLKGVVVLIVPEGALQSIIISGVIDGMGGVLGFVPLIMFMFFSIAIMEDSGYMARVAYMLDRVLRWFGLHGNSVMALIISGGISGGCAVPGVMATRTLRDPKERIATILVLPFMNCGAKLPVYAVLIAAFFANHQAGVMFLMTILSWTFALFAAKLIRSTILRGTKTPFVMELPPYRCPTFRGLLIHTWERTWEYIKKAGTVILGFSIIIWAMMTYPGISKEQAEYFERQQNRIAFSFLASTYVKGTFDDIKDIKDIKEINHFFDSFTGETEENVIAPGENTREDTIYNVAKAAYFLKEGSEKTEFRYRNIASGYLKYRSQRDNLNRQQKQIALQGTIAGWLGKRLETITRPLGFDYRTNIALVGGFAAKEVIISTLGTAYSLGAMDSGENRSLSLKLKKDPAWNPLTAFTLIIFTMLYVPCFVTVICIKKESSWAWAGFSIVFNLSVAYFVSLIIRQLGLVSGIGI